MPKPVTAIFEDFEYAQMLEALEYIDPEPDEHDGTTKEWYMGVYKKVVLKRINKILTLKAKSQINIKVNEDNIIVE